MRPNLVLCRDLATYLVTTETTHSGHAFEIARALPLDFDAVVTVSGDGVIHEVMNGFADHEDPLKAFSIPVAPIPAGSGNGLSLNLLGIKVSFFLTTTLSVPALTNATNYIAWV